MKKYSVFYTYHFCIQYFDVWNTTLHSRVAISKYYQCYMLHYQPLIIYVVILWKIWTIIDIDLLDTTNTYFGCIIIVGKVFAKSFHHAPYGKYEMSARQIMMSMYLLWRVKKMKSTIWILMTKIFFNEWYLNAQLCKYNLQVHVFLIVFQCFK